MTKAKIYLSDEGFGHIVRQRAIINELLKLSPAIELTLQTHQHIQFAKKNIKANHFIDKFNNIIWHKNQQNSPDLGAIESYYKNYHNISSAFIKEEEGAFDFYISDFVYEAFIVAKQNSKPSFGVSHFTWDWFFSKLYPPTVSGQTLNYFFEAAKSARTLFFPPFTPDEILNFYKKNAVQVPLIIRDKFDHKQWKNGGNRVKILIMDSGAGLMKDAIVKALSDKRLEKTNYYFATPYELTIENSFQISKNELLIDYVKNADLVIGRPGFNTISECIALRIPMLLISEVMNPEMEHNIIELMKHRLGSFMSLQDFENSLSVFLDKFFDKEYSNLKENMNKHAIAINGAEIIAKKILENV